MRIGLIDVDSHNFPNLALMKISAWHKQRGDHVEWWNGLMHYDRVYKSKIFTETYSHDIDWCINADEIIKGGTGYDLKNTLPDEIEHSYPDYDLYKIKEKSFGHLTRGCPRGCPFCIVKEKEGNVHTVADLDEFWRGQKEIVVMDSNITASKDCVRLFRDLAQTGSLINFEGGLDVRFMDDEKASLINKMRLSRVHFAWDNYEMDTYEKIRQIRPLLKFHRNKIIVYVLTNFNTTHEQDLERIYKLREMECQPFVMVYDKPNAPRLTQHVQRWCNNKWVFEKCRSFDDYSRRNNV